MSKIRFFLSEAFLSEAFPVYHWTLSKYSRSFIGYLILINMVCGHDMFGRLAASIL